MSLRSTGRQSCLLPFVVLALGASHVLSAPAFSRDGGEFSATLPLAGDQVYSHLALGATGGYLVWHDNNTDGAGLGISARRIDASLSGVNGSFRVNATAAGDQEKPRVALLQDGGAVIVWQGGDMGAQRIFARFIAANGTFKTSDIQVNTYTSESQTDPSVAVLTDGSVVVVWDSYGQDGSQHGVFGQRLSNAGVKLGSEFQVPVVAANNQRSPVVLGLPAGGFVVAWVTESFAGTGLAVNAPGEPTEVSTSGAQQHDVQVYARRYAADGTPVTSAYAVSSASRTAANPAMVFNANGNGMVVWSSRALPVAGQPRLRDGWDIFARGLDATGQPTGAEFRVNGHVQGDQYLPQVASLDSRFIAVWTSLGQDGSREGVFARSLYAAGVVGDEAQVNTEAAGQQMLPTVAGTGGSSTLVAWSSFVGGVESFEIFSQRLASAPGIGTPDAPFVLANAPGSLSVTWPEVSGLGEVVYQLFVDGATAPIELGVTHYSLSGLQPGSPHSFKLGYKLADGRVSAASPAASGTVWGFDYNFDVLPDDWQAAYWPGAGAKPGAWVDSDGDGATNLQELLAGTNPVDAGSALKLQVVDTPQGRRLTWKTQPGAVYQVQTSTDLGTWASMGPERFAADTTDSVGLSGGSNLQLYRVLRIR